MEKEHLVHSDTLIVGAGLSGLALAYSLSHLADPIPCTVIDPRISQMDSLQLKSRISTPIARGSLIKKLNVPLNSQKAVYERGVYVDKEQNYLGLLMIACLKLIHHYKISTNPVYFLDIEQGQKDLYESLRGSSSVNFIPEKASDILVENNRIIKIATDGGLQFCSPKLVIDATGRQARVAKEAAKSIPNLIVERNSPHPSTVLGGFIALSEDAWNENNRSVRNSSNLFFMQNELVCIVSPIAELTGSLATHAFFFEGSSNTIQTAIREIRGKSMQANSSQMIIETMRYLTLGTKLERLTQNINYIDRVVNFSHKNDVKRKLAVDTNLILVGDAQCHANPVVGRGFDNIIDDVNTIQKLMTKSQRLDQVASLYNAGFEKRAVVRAAHERMRYTILDVVSSVFNIDKVHG